MKTTLIRNVLLLLGLCTLISGAAYAQGKGHGKHGDGGEQGNGRGNGHGGWKHGGDDDRGRGAVMPQYQQPGTIIVQQRGNGHGHGRWAQPQQQQVYIPQQPQPAPWVLSWPRNHGQERSAEVHARNEARKAAKEQEKAYERQQRQVYRNAAPYYPQQVWPQYQQRVYQQPQIYSPQPRVYSQQRQQRVYQQPSYDYPYRSQQPVYEYQYRAQQQPVYRQPYRGWAVNSYDPYSDSSGYYGDTGRPSAKDLLRNIIFSILGGGAGITSPFNDNGYYDTAYPTYGYRSPYVPIRRSVSYSYVPSYSSSQPYGYYAPYGPAPAYDTYDGASRLDQLSEFIPTGNSYVQQIFTDLLAVGYTRGYQDGQAARRRHVRNALYDDPYAYDLSADDEIYDPYSVSLGQNRRCLSQGYDLGYEDAMRNDRSAVPFIQNGNVDLLGVLLSTVSGLS